MKRWIYEFNAQLKGVTNMVYVLLAEGFEEVEALTPVDLLRRAGVETRLVGVTGATVCGARGINVVTDLSMDEVDLAKGRYARSAGRHAGARPICTRTSALPMRFARWQMQASTLRPSARLRPSFWGGNGSARGQESHLLSGHGGRHDGRDPGQGGTPSPTGRSSPAAV